MLPSVSIWMIRFVHQSQTDFPRARFSVKNGSEQNVSTIFFFFFFFFFRTWVSFWWTVWPGQEEKLSHCLLFLELLFREQLPRFLLIHFLERQRFRLSPRYWKSSLLSIFFWSFQGPSCRIQHICFVKKWKPKGGQQGSFCFVLILFVFFLFGTHNFKARRATVGSSISNSFYTLTFGGSDGSLTLVNGVPFRMDYAWYNEVNESHFHPCWC